MTKKEKAEINKLLHDYLRLRWGDKCLHCGKQGILSMSHIFSKGSHRSMEFDEDNIIFLCYRCHIHFWHKSPIEASEWIKSVLPKEQYQRIYLRANTVQKGTRNYKLIKLYLNNKINNYANQKKGKALKKEKI